MRLLGVLIIAVVMLVTGLATNLIAGHHYYGHGCGYGKQGVADMDANQDGSITFDEFSEPHMNKLRAKFKMLDMDNNELIDENEWKQFLKWHGMEDESKTQPTG